MSVEKERKFLINVKELPSEIRDGSSLEKTHIVQGYLSFDPVVRIRIAKETNCSAYDPSPLFRTTYEQARAYLTVKGPGMLLREEFEYPIPLEEAEQMFALTKSRLSKMRYYLDGWEIDQFEGHRLGLWLAEFEYRDDTHAHGSVSAWPFPEKLPAWVGKEVTNDPMYQNFNLAGLQDSIAKMIE